MRKGKELLLQTIALLFGPLLCQEVLDGGGTRDESSPIPPDAIRSVRFRNCFRISDHNQWNLLNSIKLEHLLTGCSKGPWPSSLWH